MEKQQEEVKEELSTYKKLSALKDSEGGKILITSIRRDIESTITTLTASYLELDEVRLKALCAKLDTDSSMLMVLLNADKNKEQAKEILKSMTENE